MTYLYSKFYIKTIKKTPYEYCNNRRRICGINCYGTLNQKVSKLLLLIKNNYNFFRRLFIKLLLEPSSISYPYRKFFAGKTFSFVLESYWKLCLQKIKSYFIMEKWVTTTLFLQRCWNELFRNGKRKENAIPMKTLNDAIEMRNTILKNRESCDLQRHSRASLLTIVVAGGPTE
jgi:NADH dehydrogenase